MILNDKQITELAKDGMIHPFCPELVQRVSMTGVPAWDTSGATNFNPAASLHPEPTIKVLSYGLGSYGYDIRLSSLEFAIFRHIPGRVVDPKNFKSDSLENVPLQVDENGKYFIIPGNSYGLGVALEYLNIPDNITVLCIGKSTYARAGIIANVTPGEAGWKGHLTLEFSNSSPADCRIYAGEGVVQLLFLRGVKCSTTYQTRKLGGKYQNQTENITHSRV